MKNVILFIFITLLQPFHLFSQKDTIFRKDGKIIPCTITLINENSIFYKDKKDFGDEILLDKLNFFSQSGARKKLYDPSIIDYKYYKVDTSFNELGKIKLSKVIEFPDTTLTKEKLFNKVKDFIRTNISVNGNLFEDKETGKFICEVLSKKLFYNGEIVKNCNAGYFKYKLIIYVKNQKLKVVFDDITHFKGLCPNGSLDGSDFGDELPRAWINNSVKFNTNQYLLLKQQVFKEFITIINNLENINKTVKKDDGEF